MQPRRPHHKNDERFLNKFKASDSPVVLLYLSLEYIAGMLGWLMLLAAVWRLLLVWRRRFRGVNTRLRWIGLGLSSWMLLAAVTGCELYFAMFVDESDAMNMTNLSQRWFARHVEAQRNAFGARDIQEFHHHPPEGRRRIVFVGDSFTIGHGVPRREDRFSDRIGSELERSRPGRFQVANLADPGLEISQIEARVHGLLRLEYKIDLVVYVICLNDIEGYDQRTAAAIADIQTAQPRSFLLTRTYFLNWLYFRYLQSTHSGARDYFPHLVESYESDAWTGFARKLASLHARCREHGAELRVVVFPFLTELGDDYPFLGAHRKITEFCKSSEIPVLDLEPVFRPHSGEDLVVNRFDSHPNERAHKIAANAIRRGSLADLFQQEQATGSSER